MGYSGFHVGDGHTKLALNNKLIDHLCVSGGERNHKAPNTYFDETLCSEHMLRNKGAEFSTLP